MRGLFEEMKFRHAVNKLIDDSQDVLLKALDKKVSVRALQFVVSMY